MRKLLKLFMLILSISFSYKIYINIFPHPNFIVNPLSSYSDFYTSYNYAYANTPTYIQIYYDGGNEILDKLCYYPCKLMTAKSKCLYPDVSNYKDFSYSFFTYIKPGICNFIVQVNDINYSFIIVSVPFKPKIDLKILSRKIYDYEGIINFEIESDIELKKCILYFNSSNMIFYNNPVEGIGKIFVDYKIIKKSDFIPVMVNGYCIDKFDNVYNISKSYILEYNEIPIDFTYTYSPKYLYLGKKTLISILLNFSKPVKQVCYNILATNYISKYSGCTKNRINFYVYLPKNYEKNYFNIPIELEYQLDKIYKTKIELFFNIMFKPNIDVSINYDSLKCYNSTQVFCSFDLYVYNLNERKIDYIKLYIQNQSYIIQNLDANDYDFITVNVKYKPKIKIKICYNYCLSKELYLPLKLPPQTKNNIGILIIIGIIGFFVILKVLKKLI